MKTDDEMNRIQNAAEHVYMDRIRQNTGRGRYLAVAAIALITLFWLLFSCSALNPAAAQATTVTPWPGPAATATAAANMQAQASAQRNQADALQRQADAARAQADASYNAAAQAASDARAALAAQQAGAAGEAIGRAEASIGEGKAQLSAINDVVTQLRGIIDAQSGTLISMTIALQQAQADKQTTLNAYHAALANQEQSDRNTTLLQIVGTFIAFVFLVVLIVFARDRLRHRMMRNEDDGAATIIDNDGRIET